MAEENGEGFPPIGESEAKIASQVDEAFAEKGYKSEGQYGLPRRSRLKLRIAAGITALAVSGGGIAAGVTLTSNGGGEHHATTISQSHEKKTPAETNTEKALQALKIDSPDRLIVNEQEQQMLAERAITDVSGTMYEGLSGGKVGEFLKKLKEMSPIQLLKNHVYSWANQEDHEVYTTLALGGGSVWNPDEPSVTVVSNLKTGTEFNQDLVLANINSKKDLLPSITMQPSDKQVFSTNPNDLRYVDTVLGDLLADASDQEAFSSTGIDTGNPDIAPTVSYYDANNNGNLAQLGTDGFLTLAMNKTPITSSFNKITGVTNPDQAEQVVAFAAIKNYQNPMPTDIPGLTSEQRKTVSFIVSKGLSAMPQLSEKGSTS